MFGKGNLFVENDMRMQHVGEVVIDVVTNPEDVLSGLLSRLPVSTLQRSDRMDLVVHSVQNSDSFQLVPYLYPIPSLEPSPATVGELMFGGYYVWDMQACT